MRTVTGGNELRTGCGYRQRTRELDITFLYIDADRKRGTVYEADISATQTAREACRHLTV